MNPRRVALLLHGNLTGALAGCCGDWQRWLVSGGSNTRKQFDFWNSLSGSTASELTKGLVASGVVVALHRSSTPRPGGDLWVATAGNAVSPIWTAWKCAAAYYIIIVVIFPRIMDTGQHFNRNSILYSLPPPRSKEKHSSYELTGWYWELFTA